MRQVGTRLPASVHDRLMTLSNRNDVPVHELVREAVTLFVRVVKQDSNRSGGS